MVEGVPSFPFVLTISLTVITRNNVIMHCKVYAEIEKVGKICVSVDW